MADDRRRASSHVLLGDIGGQMIALDDDVEHHLRRVLRLRDGDDVSVTDGAGSWRMSRVRLSGSTLSLEAVGEIVVEERSDRFTLATAIPKGDRVDWLVQKTVEIGVDRIVFVDAERSAVRWKPDRAVKQLTRLRRIADESTRQSRRVWRTEIDGPVPAAELLGDAVIAEPGGAPVRGDEPLVAIGPEGGWTESELALSPRRVGLGSNILRVETAAVAVATLRVLL
ncbi:RsmE family RNA methyltransferase [Ilumatobacter sp.]|uniref:RsmE family RNA methyltransferase n=1 Tax=Ilumatobacter sp. TaxID=1967498 RepID=UPI003C3DEE0C